MKIHAIAFDLDDTLLDTTGLLTPKASKEAFQVLIDAGLELDIDDCERKRLEMIKTTSHREVFQILAEDFGSDKTKMALDLANKTFYQPRLPEKLPLLPGALENLTILSQKYALYIVTAGFQASQEAKIKSLGIGHFFKKTFVVNSLNQEKKYDSFKKILELEKIQPDQLLCVGNSLLSEMKDAREIGAWACYFEFGEERGLISTNKNLKPHFHIKTHQELIPTCQL